MSRVSGLTYASLIVSFVFVGTSAALGADWEKQKATDYQLPDPPNASETAIEIDQLLELQAERTDAECKLGRREQHPGFGELFSGKIFLTAQDIKTLTPLMKRVSRVGENVAQSFKSKYMRTRPYDVDSRLKPCVPLPGGQKSYPSSHATVSTLDACILSFIFNDTTKRDQLRLLASELSERRMKVGVHFPSDVRAGQDLGTMICHSLAADKEFQSEVELVQNEL